MIDCTLILWIVFLSGLKLFWADFTYIWALYLSVLGICSAGQLCNVIRCTKLFIDSGRRKKKNGGIDILYLMQRDIDNCVKDMNEGENWENAVLIGGW